MAIHTCRTCGGDLVRAIETVRSHGNGQGSIGRNLAWYYCSRCGLMYWAEVIDRQ